MTQQKCNFKEVHGLYFPDSVINYSTSTQDRWIFIICRYFSLLDIGRCICKILSSLSLKLWLCFLSVYVNIYLPILLFYIYDYNASKDWDIEAEAPLARRPSQVWALSPLFRNIDSSPCSRTATRVLYCSLSQLPCFLLVSTGCHGPGEMAPGIYAECIDVWIQNKGCDVQEIWTELSCCRNYTWRPARFLIVIPGVIASFEFYLYRCTVQEHLLNVYDFFSVYAVRHAHFSSRLCRACVMAPRPFVCIRGFLYGYVSAQRCC